MTYVLSKILMFGYIKLELNEKWQCRASIILYMVDSELIVLIKMVRTQPHILL